MSGILGLITRAPQSTAEGELRAMLASVCRGSSDLAATWCDHSSGVYVGWAARQNSCCDATRVASETGRVVIIVSGEDFTERASTGQCEEKRRYLIDLYEEDFSFPSSLNGRLHGLVIDRTDGAVVLFNDRYGMKRIYYYESRDAFYFAAEAKAILAVRSELRCPDPAGLGEFVSFGCVLNNRSLFAGISVLPPASRWVFRNGGLSQKGAYFQPREWENQPQLDAESYYQDLRQVLAQNIPRYFSGSGPIAMSLTGGLDTRMILAWQRPKPGSLPCYTFGGMYRDCLDVRIARQVAQACGQSHHVIRVGEDFLENFATYAERTVYLTDGSALVNRSADLYVNEKAREIAPIRMTGNYGGEVLRRVRAFKPRRSAPLWLHPELKTYFEQAQTTYDEAIRIHPLSFAAFRQAPWHHYGLLALEETQIVTRTPYLDNDLVRLVFRAPASACTNNDVSLRLIRDGNPELLKIPTDRGLGGNRGLLAATASHKSHEFTFKAEYAYDYGMPQWLAAIDHLCSRLRLERLFLGRHKFYHYRVWYRDFLAGYMREMLLDQRSLSRSYLQRKKVEMMVQRHLKGDRNYTSEIHMLLTLELIHRLFIDSCPEPVESRPRAVALVQ